MAMSDSMGAQFDSVISSTVSYFRTNVQGLYSLSEMKKLINESCAGVNADGFKMKSKYRKALFREVEYELPLKMDDRLGGIIDRALSDCSGKLIEIVSKKLGCDAVLSEVRSKLEQLREQLAREIQGEEINHLKSNLMIIGGVAVTGMALGVLAGGVGVMGLGGLVGVAIAGSVVATFELAWSGCDVRSEFVTEIGHQLVKAAHPDTMCASFEKLLNMLGVSDFAKAADAVKQNPLTAFTIITSGSKGKALLPLIHPCFNVTAIHVFCANKHFHEAWASEYMHPAGKICGIHADISTVVAGLSELLPTPRISFIRADTLAKCVEEAQRVYVHSQVQDEVEKTSFKEAVGCLLKARERKFNIAISDADIKHFSRLFDPSESCHEELLGLYTEEKSHIYDTLNPELRVKKRNQDLLKLMKLAESFLYAMQVTSVNNPELVYSGTSYRAMWVSDEEISQYENSKDQIIFFRAFTSSSTNRARAVPFAERSWAKKRTGKKVMLEIDCSSLDASLNCIRPLKIQKFSKFPGEEEVLIPLLTGYMVAGVTSESNNWVHVHLRLVFAMPDMTAAFMYAFI
eukprot:TRINITY_DN33549_c0_g1_i1.p1 TRINITY_DN33549_c0_g1~~TRINITY_DN33549_c0_g1_i1.p1  ORF type:complete len:573 (-),score=91.08 TRINITY_DN33549_c0_g1_i1:93-1811(-)